MKDLGEARDLLGMSTVRDRKAGKIQLNQSAYIRKMLQKFGMNDCKPVTTPSDPSIRLNKEMEPRTSEEICEMKKVPYREAVGSLLYASQGTRPDISFAVGCVSRYMENPGREHWTAMKRIFRYLKGTLNLGLQFDRDVSAKFKGCHGYCDADWANDDDTRRSVTGSIFLF